MCGRFAVTEDTSKLFSDLVDDLEHYEVTRDVNSVRNNGPHLIEPLT